MATSQVNKFMQQLRCVALGQEQAGLTDGQLLGCFIEWRDEAAFAALVRRHGPTVWGVCRRMLPSHHDAEDAFQATFLVLARKAASISPREMVPNWLYGVAYRIALKARTMIAKHRQREKQVMKLPEPPAATHAPAGQALEALLDQELASLPDKYRVAIVLCDLEGKTRKEAARQLKIPEGTLSSRLTTARGLLAKRFARHGILFSTGVLAGRLAQSVASARVPISLIHSTVKTATNLLPAAQAVAAGLISTKVVTLAEEVLKSMIIAKLKITMIVLTLVASALAAGELLYQSQAVEQPRPPTAEKPPTADGLKPQPEPTPVVVHQEASVHQLVYSADGKSLLTIGITYDPIEFEGGGETHKSLAPNSTIKLWDATTGQLQRSLGEEKRIFMTALAVAPDGKTVAIAATKQPRVGIGAGTEVRVMDTETWQVKRRLTADDLARIIHKRLVRDSTGVGMALALGKSRGFTNGGRTTPFPPKWFRVVPGLTARHRGHTRARSELGTELLIPMQVRPRTRETHEDTTGADDDFCGHLDDHTSPRAWLPLAQRVLSPALPKITLPRCARQRLGRHRRCHGWRGSGHLPPETHQQVQSQRVEVQAEEVGQETMVTGAIHRQVALEFLVAVLALAPSGIVVVGRLRQYERPRSIGDDKAAVGPLGVGFGLDHHPARQRPGAGLVPEGREQTLGLPAGLIRPDRLGQHGITAPLEDAVGRQAKGVIEVETLADGVHPGDAVAGVAADPDAHAGPGLAQSLHQVFQVVVGAQGGMHGAGPKRQQHDLVVVGAGDEGREILVLVEEAVEQHQLLRAVGGVVDRIQVEGQVPGRCGERGDELIDEDVTQALERSNVDGILEA